MPATVKTAPGLTGSGSGPEPGSEARTVNESTAYRLKPILLVEDNPGDVGLVREALAEYKLTGDLTVVRDGERALQFIADLDSDPAATRPGLIILDLNLPKVGGHEILRVLQNSRYCGKIPVMVMSSSPAESDRQLAKKLGAREYIRKPLHLDEFLAVGAVIEQLLRGASGIQ